MDASETPKAGKLPNIIFIMSDDVGYGDVSCYNADSKISTPNIDRLAKEGVCFTDAHSPSAVCTPTRYGVLTGRYCWRSRLKYSVLFAYEPPLIEEERPTVASLLKRAGYNTACIGKWHVGLGYTARPGQEIDFFRPLPWPSRTERSLEEQIDFAQPLWGGPMDLGFETFFGASGCPTCQPPYGFIKGRHFVELPTLYHDQPVFTSRPGMMAPSWDHRDADPTFARKRSRPVRRRLSSSTSVPVPRTSPARTRWSPSSPGARARPGLAGTWSGWWTGWWDRSWTPWSARGRPRTR